MSDIDPDGPVIEVTLDTSKVEEGAKRTDNAFGEALNSINEKVQQSEQNFSEFGGVIEKVLTNALIMHANYARSLEQFDKSVEANKQAIEKRKRDIEVEKKRKDEEERRRIIDFERRQMDRREKAIEQTKRMTASFKNFSLAMGGVFVMGGLSLQAALNFTNDLARMDLTIKSLGANAERVFHLRNLLREKGIGEQETLGMTKNIASIYRTGREKGGLGLLPPDQMQALYRLGMGNPESFKNADGSTMDMSAWQTKILEAARNFYYSENGLTKAMKIEILKPIFGSEEATQAVVELTPEELHRKDEKAKREADSLAKNRQNNAAVQELRNALETNVADVLAKMSPELIKILNAISKFASDPHNIELVVQGLKDLGLVIQQLLQEALGWMEFFGITIPDSLKELVGYKKSVQNISSEHKTDLEKSLNGVEIYKYRGSMWATEVKTKTTVPLLSADESADSIRKRLAEKKQKTNQLPTFGELLMPSAKAHELSYDASGLQLLISHRGSSRPQDVKVKQEFLEKKEQEYGLPSGILDSQWLQESGRGKFLRSRSGARGDFQFMPLTAREYKVDVNDFYSSADGAARYMKSLLKRYNGDKSKALAAYNWGMGNVDKAGNNWQELAPKETKDYVYTISRNMARSRAMQKGIKQPNLTQMQAQNQINRTVNANRSTANNQQYTVNIHMQSGDPHHVASVFSQQIQQMHQRQTGIKYPQGSDYDGTTGIF